MSRFHLGRFSIPFSKKVCVDANFDVSYLSQGSRFFNSVRYLCKCISRSFRTTKNRIIGPRTYPCIQKIAWIGLSLRSDVRYQSRCSLWFSSKSDTGSWKMQYSNNLDILLDSRHNSYTVEIPNAKDLVKRSSFSLDTDIFLGVQFYLGYPVVPFFHKCHTCNMAFPAVDRDRPNKGPPSPAKLENFEKISVWLEPIFIASESWSVSVWLGV